MKNKLIKALFGIALSLLMTTGVYAVETDTIDSIEEGSNSTSANVTVGTVEVPVYRVELWWDSLTFDWVYDEYTKTFGWKTAPLCEQFDKFDKEKIEAEINGGGSVYISDLYTDSTCSTKANAYDESVQGYYYLNDRNFASIGIRDHSENGVIVPSIEWNSSEKYSNVIGKIFYMNYSQPICSNIDSEDMLNYALENDVTLYSNNACSIVSDDANVTYEEGKYYAFVNIEAMKILGGNEIPDEARYAACGAIFDYRFTEIETRLYEEDSWARKEIYDLKFYIENDSKKEIIIPTQGDVIGTITVTFREK